MKKSLFKNAIYKSILSFANIIIPLLVGPYIVKLLDVELYGIYNTVFSEFQVFLIFASFGLYTFGMREISKIRDDKEKVSKLFSSLFLISCITNTIVCIIYVFYSFATSSGTTLIIYLLMTIQFIGNTLYIEFINESLENYKFITIKTIIVKIVYMISIFLLVKKPTDIAIYTIIICLTVFLNNVISFLYAKKYIKFDFKNVKIKKYIKPLFIILIITNLDLLYSQLDRVMLGKYVDGVAVTLYYIPYFLMSTLAAIPYSIITVSIPRLSYIVANNSKEEYENSLNKIISSLLFIIIPMGLGVFVLAYEIIFLYAGSNYMAAVVVLMLASIMRIVISCESVLTNLVMYPNNKENILLRFSLICGFLNLVLNFVLVYFKIFTPFTAMITTAVVELLLCFFLYLYISKNISVKIKLFTKQNFLYLILSLLFIPISLIIKKIDFGFYLNIIFIIISCMGLYGLTLMIVKDENFVMIKNKISGIVRRFKK